MSDIGAMGVLPGGLPTQPTPATSTLGEESSFSDTLHGAMNQIESLQGKAQSQVQDLLSGHTQDLHSTMIAVEKADLSFQLMLQVRNKIVQAYQEVSRMQI